MILKWKILIFVGILLLAVGITYGWKHYANLQERASIIEEKETIVQELEKADLEHIAEKERLYRLQADLQKRDKEWTNKYADLEAQIKNIVIPSTPDSLVDAWRKRGIRARRNMPPR